MAAENNLDKEVKEVYIISLFIKRIKYFLVIRKMLVKKGVIKENLFLNFKNLIFKIDTYILY